MTKKSKKTSQQNTNTGSIGVHSAITQSDKNALKENRDNSSWWLYGLILVILGFIAVFSLASFTP